MSHYYIYSTDFKKNRSSSNRAIIYSCGTNISRTKEKNTGSFKIHTYFELIYY